MFINLLFIILFFIMISGGSFHRHLTITNLRQKNCWHISFHYRLTIWLIYVSELTEFFSILRANNWTLTIVSNLFLHDPFGFMFFNFTLPYKKSSELILLRVNYSTFGAITLSGSTTIELAYILFRRVPLHWWCIKF
jgi:hypothetical protein